MRLFWLIFGWVSVALGAIGALLPVFPTVPFLLLAAWAFSRSSPELRAKILSHPRYGEAVRKWQDHGAISRLAKIWAVSAMSFGVGLSFCLGLDYRIVSIQALICLSVGLYVITRPEL